MFRSMRRKKQQIPQEECTRILREEKRGALAVIGDEGWPYAIPLNFYSDEEEDTIYFHCALQGHKVDAIDRCDKVCFTVWNSGEPVEGDWSYYVTSVVSMGRAEWVDDEELRLEKARLFGLKYYPSAERLRPHETGGDPRRTHDGKTRPRALRRGTRRGRIRSGRALR